MSSQLMDRSHPVAEFAGRCCARLDQLADVATWTMRPEEQRAALKDLAKAEAQLPAMRLGVLGEAERSGATDGQGGSHRRRLGRGRDPADPDRRALRPEAQQGTRRAPGPGRSPGCWSAPTSAQARVIVKALDRLPTSGEFAVSTEQRTQAEEHLVGSRRRTTTRRHFSSSADTCSRWSPPTSPSSSTGRALEAEEAAALRRTTWRCARTTKAPATASSASPPCTGRSCARSSWP